MFLTVTTKRSGAHIGLAIPELVDTATSITLSNLFNGSVIVERPLNNLSNLFGLAWSPLMYVMQSSAFACCRTRACCAGVRLERRASIASVHIFDAVKALL